MTTRKEKFLSKLPNKIKRNIIDIINDICNNDRRKHDYTKLQGEKNIFRIRKGTIRIVFSINNGISKVITVDFRGNSYKK